MWIFINYRRSDAQSIAGRIHDRLERHFKVYRDIQIPGAQDFEKHLEQALHHCDVMVAIIGRTWVSDRLNDDNDFVRRELERALERQIPIFPVLVEDAKPPASTDLPNSLHALLRLQWLRVDSGADFEAHMLRLIGDIKRTRGTGAFRNQKLYLSLAAAALIGSMLVAWTFTRQLQDPDRRPSISPATTHSPLAAPSAMGRVDKDLPETLSTGPSGSPSSQPTPEPTPSALSSVEVAPAIPGPPKDGGSLPPKVETNRLEEQRAQPASPADPQISLEPRVDHWKLVVNEQFSSPQSTKTWATGVFVDAPTPDDSTVKLARWHDPNTGDWTYRFSLSLQVPRCRFQAVPHPGLVDLYLAAKMRLVEASANDPNIGLLFGWRDDGRYYSFAVGEFTNGALFSLQRYDGSAWKQLMRHSPTSVRLAQSNRLAVSIVSQRIQLFINGDFVGEYVDPSYLGGWFGVYVSGNSPGSIIVDFDDFEVRRPPFSIQ